MFYISGVSVSTLAVLGLFFILSPSLRLLFLDVERSFLSRLRSLLFSLLPLHAKQKTQGQPHRRHLWSTAEMMDADGVCRPEGLWCVYRLGEGDLGFLLGLLDRSLLLFLWPLPRKNKRKKLLKSIYWCFTAKKAVGQTCGETVSTWVCLFHSHSTLQIKAVMFSGRHTFLSAFMFIGIAIRYI